MTLLLPHRRPLLGLPFCRNALWLRARAVPSFDVPFADSKSLVDAITGRQLISFARAGSGAYTDSAGVLQTAATDVPRFDHRITSTTTNLATRSEEFDNATWAQTGLNAFGSGSVANAIAAPNGTVTGDLIEEDTSTGFHRVSQTLISGTISTGTYTASVYVKAAQRSRAYISLDDNATGEVTAGFATLTQLFNITTAGSWSGSTASIEDVGDGWFRISLTSTKGDGSSALTLRVGIAQINVTTISYTGSGTGGLYVWGAQLVASDSNGQYVRTTAAAASVSTTESLGLLVEEQRTNLVLRSSEISLSLPWGSQATTPTVATGAFTAPDGSNTATRVTFAAADSRVIQGNLSVVNGTTYTLSLYARPVTAGTLNKLRLACFDSVNQQNSNDLTLVAGWQRISFTFTSTGTGLATINIRNEVAASNANDIYIWGAQLEAGAFATSYIPTTTAAATRNADVAQITGTNFSSWYRQDEGTAYVDATLNGIASQNYFCAFPSGTVFDNSHLLYAINGATRGETFTATASQAAIILGSATAGQRQGIAYSYRVNNFAGARNGTLGTPDTSGSLPTPDRLTIGMAFSSALQLNGTIRRLVYWPQALPGQLQANTQP